NAAPPPDKWATVRRFKRAPARGERVTLGALGEFDVINISIGGIFLASPAPPPVGTEVAFSLALKDTARPLDMKGVVIRHGKDGGHAGFAIEFIRLNPAHKRVLESYIGG